MHRLLEVHLRQEADEVAADEEQLRPQPMEPHPHLQRPAQLREVQVADEVAVDEEQLRLQRVRSRRLFLQPRTAQQFLLSPPRRQERLRGGRVGDEAQLRQRR